MKTPSPLSIATFAGGCFWCLEAVFQRVRGVEKVVSGYTGGVIARPTYEQICAGNSGHAEAVQVYFDPTHISYQQLLSIFWEIHDPTTRNRQGNDIGTQYRSVIFYANDEQRNEAEESKKLLNKSGKYSDPIITEIEPLGTFYTAEKYHQNYYNLNRTQPYCRVIIDPKVQKLLKKYSSLVTA